MHIPPGPPSDAEPLFLLANDPFVLGYPCLPWLLHPAAGAAPARASVPHFVAVRVFLLRNTIGTDAASTNAAATRSPITLLFNAAAWSRWFSEMVASGLLNSAPFQRVRDSDRAITAESRLLTMPQVDSPICTTGKHNNPEGRLQVRQPYVSRPMCVTSHVIYWFSCVTDHFAAYLVLFAASAR